MQYLWYNCLKTTSINCCCLAANIMLWQYSECNGILMEGGAFLQVFMWFFNDFQSCCRLPASPPAVLSGPEWGTATRRSRKNRATPVTSSTQLLTIWNWTRATFSCWDRPVPVMTTGIRTLCLLHFVAVYCIYLQGTFSKSGEFTAISCPINSFFSLLQPPITYRVEIISSCLFLGK